MSVNAVTTVSIVPSSRLLAQFVEDSMPAVPPGPPGPALAAVRSAPRSHVARDFVFLERPHRTLVLSLAETRYQTPKISGNRIANGV